MNNSERADRAQAALDAYIDHTGDSPDESHFRDLLCDLMHLAERDGAGEHLEAPHAAMTFGEALEMATAGFAFEFADDGAEYGEGAGS